MDIQKAAEEYLKTVDLNEQMSITGKVDIVEAFLAGTEYQRNSTWHDMKEKPIRTKRVVVMANYSGIKEFQTTLGEYIESFQGLKWAYLSDILPTNK